MIKHLTKYQFVRYVLGGGTAACVNLATLYIFNSLLGVYYIYASMVAWVVAFGVSLAFHKFWTFKDHRRDNLHTQGALYLLTSLFGLAVNTLILYISVSGFHLPVLVGQIIAGALTACCTFFISKHIVFKKKAVHTTEEVLDEFL